MTDGTCLCLGKTFRAGAIDKPVYKKYIYFISQSGKRKQITLACAALSEMELNNLIIRYLERIFYDYSLDFAEPFTLSKLTQNFYLHRGFFYQ